MRQRLAVLAAGLAVVLLGAPAAPASAQTVDITVEPENPAPGAQVTVVVSGAPADESVVVVLGAEEEDGETDATGFASVVIAAPTQIGQALGTVLVGTDEFSFSVVVQAADAGGGTESTTTTSTLPTPTSEPPVTGIDDAGTMAAIGAAFLAAGLGLVFFTRRPGVAATTTRGATTHYRLLGSRRRR